MAKPVRGGDVGRGASEPPEYTDHPYLAFVPLLDVERYNLMLSDIRRTGAPTGEVIVDSRNRILSGREQFRACREANVNPKIRITPRQDVAHLILGTLNSVPDLTNAEWVLLGARLYEPLRKERLKSGENFPPGKTRDIVASLVPKANGKWIAEMAAMLKADPQLDLIPLIEQQKVAAFSDVQRVHGLEGIERQDAIARLMDGEPITAIFEKPKVADDLWFTPPEIVAAIRAAFGGTIACDPCAPVGGGSYVDAKHPYTTEDDGLDRKNPWFTKTFVNPPFSKPKRWVKRVLEEAEAGKHIYLLLPVRPASPYHQAVINRALDYLVLDKRPVFHKPDTDVDNAGQNAIMIAGFNITTQLLKDMGIAGTLVTPSDRRTVTIKNHPKDEEKDVWTLEPSPSDEEFEVDYIPTDVTEEEARLQRALSDQQDAEEDRAIAEGISGIAVAKSEGLGRKPAGAKRVPKR